MLPDRVSNPGRLTYESYESGALPIALRGPADIKDNYTNHLHYKGDFFF